MDVSAFKHVKMMHMCNKSTIIPFFLPLCQELNNYRSKCSMLFHDDWISIPLVYTQVKLIWQISHGCSSVWSSHFCLDAGSDCGCVLLFYILPNWAAVCETWWRQNSSGPLYPHFHSTGVLLLRWLVKGMIAGLRAYFVLHNWFDFSKMKGTRS